MRHGPAAFPGRGTARQHFPLRNCASYVIFVFIPENITLFFLENDFFSVRQVAFLRLIIFLGRNYTHANGNNVTRLKLLCAEL